MVSCSRASLAVFCVIALVGTFFVLESAPAHRALRGERRRLDGADLAATGSNLADSAAHHASNAASAVGNHASNAASAISDHWDEHGEHYKDKAKELGGHVWQHTKNVGGHVWGHTKNAASAVHQHFKENGADYANAVKDKATEWGGAAWHHGGRLAGHLGEHASNLGNHVWENRDEYHDRVRNHVKEYGWWNYAPQDYFLSWVPRPIRLAIPVLQLIFFWVYWCLTVQHYGYWMGPTAMSQQLQSVNAPLATMNTSPTNCILSWLCPQARAAHTFDKTGTLDYWLSLPAMFCCPCLTLCLTNACTDLNPKLGGVEQNPISSCLCTWLCSCCVIAQDAESLDAATGQQTGCCGVSGGMPPYGMGYPGMGMPGPGMPPQGPGMYPGGAGMYSGAPMYSGGPSMFPNQMRMQGGTPYF